MSRFHIGAPVISVLGICLLFQNAALQGQTIVAQSTGGTTQSVGGNPAAPPTAAPTRRSAGPLTPIAVAQGQPNLGRITAGNGTLPNDAGQVWREYDLTPYTSRVKDVEKPEQAIVDWVLRETGTEIWFSSPLGILNADRNTLRVYHKPQVQELVKGVYDRFLANSAEPDRLALRIVTAGSPTWRARVLPLLRPVDVKSPGVEAWLVSRENAVVLVNELRQRADVRELAGQILEIQNGQSRPTGLTRPRNYVRSIKPVANVFGGFEPDNATLQEGYSLELSPLLSTDGKTLDLVMKCSIDQVERMIDVPLDVPGGGPRVSIQVPQLVSWRLHERFRWPTDQVLVLSCGVVAAPASEQRVPLLGGLLGGSPRADALLFVESLGAGGPTVAAPLPLPLASQPLTTPATAPAAAATAAVNPVPGASATIASQPNPPMGSAATSPATAAGFNPFIASPAVPSQRGVEPFRR